MNLWPWVSRRAFDMAVEERDHLREKNDRLEGQLVRLVRRTHKLPEVATDQRENKKKRPPIPPEVMEEIEAWDNPATQTIIKNRALQLYRETKSWKVVKDKIAEEMK